MSVVTRDNEMVCMAARVEKVLDTTHGGGRMPRQRGMVRVRSLCAWVVVVYACWEDVKVGDDKEEVDRPLINLLRSRRHCRAVKCRALRCDAARARSA